MTTSKKYALLIIACPILITLAYFFLIKIPGTKSFALWMVKENRPVELLTFVLFLFGSFYGIRATFKNKQNLKKPVFIFYAFFSFSLFILAMEEVAWGQWFLRFETPETWAKINKQGETTLHNLNAMGGHNEILRMIYGFGGLTAALILAHTQRFKIVSAHKTLLSWFIIIFALSILDFLEEEKFIVVNFMDIKGFRKSSELVELLIAGSSCLYLFLNFKSIKGSSNTN